MIIDYKFLFMNKKKLIMAKINNYYCVLLCLLFVLCFLDIPSGSFCNAIYIRHLKCCKCTDCLAMNKLKVSPERLLAPPVMQDTATELIPKIFDVCVLQDDLECKIQQNILDNSSFCDSMKYTYRHHQENSLIALERRSTLSKPSQQVFFDSVNLSVSPVYSLSQYMYIVQSLRTLLSQSLHQPITEAGSSLSPSRGIESSARCVEVDGGHNDNNVVASNTTDTDTDTDDQYSDITITSNDTIIASICGLYDKPAAIQHTDQCVKSINIMNYVMNSLKNLPATDDEKLLSVASISQSMLSLTYGTRGVQVTDNSSETECVLHPQTVLFNELASLQSLVDTWSLNVTGRYEQAIQQTCDTFSHSQTEHVVGRLANVCPESGDEIAFQRRRSFSFLRQLSNPSLNEPNFAVHQLSSEHSITPTIV